MPPVPSGKGTDDGIKLPSIVKSGGSRNSGNDPGAAKRADNSSQKQAGLVLDGKLLVQKEQAIKFKHCSPGQIIEMSKYLGVDPDWEFYLLPVVRRAVISPFPQDWAVGVDRLGQQYYYNKYTCKVINSHPLSELFIDWIADSRRRKSEEAELRRQDTYEEEEVEEDLGSPWMRFEAEAADGLCYWFNFKIRKLYSDRQYKHILNLELEDRAAQSQKGQMIDVKKQAELEFQLKLKKATQKFFASGLRKFWMKWQLFVMELREQRKSALIKSGMVSGRMEAKGFRQWKEKAEQLSFVRRAMAPLGGRRDKQIMRDILNLWKEFVHESLRERKEGETLKDYFRAWKSACGEKRQMEKKREIIRAMLLGNAISTIFREWKNIWQTNKDHEAKILTEACIKIQRQHRARMKKKSESRAAVNQRKQIKYRLLRVCETQETTLDVSQAEHERLSRTLSSASQKQELEDTEGGSLAVFLLEGALQKAQDETEKARLRNVVRIAKSKSTVLPDEPGYGTESVRDDIYRIVDILDPIDRVKLRSRIESVAAHKRKDAQDDSDDDDDEEEEDEAGEEEAASSGGSPRKDRKLKLKVGPGKLVELGDAVDTLIHKIVEASSNPSCVQDQGEFDAFEKKVLAEPVGSLLQQVAEKTKGYIDRTLRPEEKSKALHNRFVVDDRVSVLEELDSAIEIFLNTVDKKKMEDQEQGW